MVGFIPAAAMPTKMLVWRRLGRTPEPIWGRTSRSRPAASSTAAPTPRASWTTFATRLPSNGKVMPTTSATSASASAPPRVTKKALRYSRSVARRTTSTASGPAMGMEPTKAMPKPSKIGSRMSTPDHV